jgi:hypothetical protein
VWQQTVQSQRALSAPSSRRNQAAVLYTVKCILVAATAAAWHSSRFLQHICTTFLLSPSSTVWDGHLTSIQSGLPESTWWAFRALHYRICATQGLTDGNKRCCSHLIYHINRISYDETRAASHPNRSKYYCNHQSPQSATISAAHVRLKSKAMLLLLSTYRHGHPVTQLNQTSCPHHYILSHITCSCLSSDRIERLWVNGKPLHPAGSSRHTLQGCQNAAGSTRWLVTTHKLAVGKPNPVTYST